MKCTPNFSEWQKVGLQLEQILQIFTETPLSKIDFFDEFDHWTEKNFFFTQVIHPVNFLHKTML